MNVKSESEWVRSAWGVVLSAACAAALSGAAVAGPVPPPDYGYQWATITHPGNAPYTGPVVGSQRVLGRGTVNYEYRISKTEITTAQWAEFVNTFATQANFPITLFGRPSFTNSVPIWGAFQDPFYSGPGRRFVYHPNEADRPVFGIRWRWGAMYANWLHNDKSSDWSAVFGGAYDTTTWDSDGWPHTDALTHEPGARFWIPTLDEWLKAVYYDPHKNGQDQEGWWQWVNGSDEPPIPGLPGTPGATTSAGLPSMGVGDPNDPMRIRVGAYPDAQSPWGLLDTAGGASEWNEEPYNIPDFFFERGYQGASAFNESNYVLLSHVSALGSSSLDLGSIQTIRLASAVPSPSVVWGACFLWLYCVALKRRSRDDKVHAAAICRDDRRVVPRHRLASADHHRPEF
ncbi:MAG: SUMF1/EgtB/PvdO family nonheme iron enzyme [Phycisphaeraceae bacterium]|nr:SUMF1/EgtB/PvdO family nonheme iron enzyme [Phycisphaeraceae bacterium]